MSIAERLPNERPGPINRAGPCHLLHLSQSQLPCVVRSQGSCIPSRHDRRAWGMLGMCGVCRTAADGGAVADALMPSAPRNAMSYRYLLVDVSATTRALVKRAIRESGLGVDRFYEAATADEVMDVLEQHPVDLILADPRLPDADGAELLARVMAEPDTRGIPVVVMATRMDPRKAEYLRRRGVRGIIRKPVSSANFREVVGQILEPTHV